MRVIAGEYRSRRLKSVPGLAVRPTPDRLRESLFSILMPRLPGAVFADVYAGSGSVGIEALSRGAKRAHFVETNREAVAVLRENLTALGAQGRANVIRRSAAAALAELQADIVFLDPPYDRPAEFALAMEAAAGNALLLERRPTVIVQHPPKQPMAMQYGPLREYRVVKQGDNWLRFYRLEEAVDEVTDEAAGESEPEVVREFDEERLAGAEEA